MGCEPAWWEGQGHGQLGDHVPCQHKVPSARCRGLEPVPAPALGLRGNAPDTGHHLQPFKHHNVTTKREAGHRGWPGQVGPPEAWVADFWDQDEGVRGWGLRVGPTSVQGAWSLLDTGGGKRQPRDGPVPATSGTHALPGRAGIWAVVWPRNGPPGRLLSHHYLGGTAPRGRPWGRRPSGRRLLAGGVLRRPGEPAGVCVDVCEGDSVTASVRVPCGGRLGSGP